MKTTTNSSVGKDIVRLCLVLCVLFFGPLVQAVTLNLPEAGSTHETTDVLEWYGMIGLFHSGIVDFGTYDYANGMYTYHQEKEVGPLPMTGNGVISLFTPCPPGGWVPGDANHYARLKDDPAAPAINYFITINP